MAEKVTGELKTFDAKGMIAKHAAAGTVVKYAERKKVEIIAATKHYHVGQTVTPHKIMADALIEQGIAKEVK